MNNNHQFLLDIGGCPSATHKCDKSNSNCLDIALQTTKHLKEHNAISPWWGNSRQSQSDGQLLLSSQGRPLRNCCKDAIIIFKAKELRAKAEHKKTMKDIQRRKSNGSPRYSPLKKSSIN